VLTSDPDFLLDGPGAYLNIQNLSIHNLMLDTFLEACSGALLCGHIAVDTRNKPFGGHFHYYDQTVGQPDIGIVLHADMKFPQGFNADYRYTDFRNEDVPPGGHYTQEWGHVSCNSDWGDDYVPQATLLVDIDDAISAAASLNFFGRYLCHIYDTSAVSPWYPNG
jgi:hypothetical protein